MNSAVPFWFQSADEGGTPVPPIPTPDIGRSLRILGGNGTAGTPVLNCPVRTAGNRSWTWSGWIKYSFEIFALFTPRNNTGASSGLWFSNGIVFQTQGTNQPDSWAGGVRLSDQAAWYHIVFSVDQANNRTTGYVNGLEVGTPNVVNNTYMGFNGTMGFQVGSRNNCMGDGYVADVYLLEDVLEPTDFGRFNDNGIWVPIQTAFTAAQFGSNGFHLEFADPNDLGADTAPIGTTGHTAANNFTATGFDTDPVGIFSENLTAGTTAAYQANQADRTGTITDAEDAFDGNTSSSAFVDDTAQPCPFMYFNPTRELTGITSLFYRTAGTIAETRINGNVVTIDSTGTGTRWVEVNNPPATLTEFAFSCADGFSQLVAIGINGTATDNILVNNNGVDYDSMQDSPTQNYSTINPLSFFEGGRADIERANLSIESSSDGGWFASQTQINQEHFYFEMTLTAAATAGANSGTSVGITRDFLNNSTSRVRWITTDVLNVFGTETTNWAGTTWGAEGDVLGCEYDRANTRVRFYLNGTLEGTVTNAGLADGNFVPLIQNSSSTGSSFLAFNFGQQPFVHRPAGLDDTNNLQTQNMPAAPVTDGRDYFRVVQAAGPAVLACAQGELNDQHGSTGFASGLWWIKDIANDNQHQFVDNVTNALVNSGNVANTSPTINQATAQAYVAPSGNSVGWCWNSTDPDNSGFNIVTYTGNAPNDQVINHGLPGVPQMIITQPVSGTTRNYAVYHSGLPNPPGQFLQINGDDSATNSTELWADTAPNATSFSVGNANTTNFAGAVYTAYCWSEISGYSAFGSYIGNNNNNGPFIYTGFTPAFLMIKASGTGSWFVMDSTRSPNNPVGDYLFPNNDDEQDESTSVNDFYSNGFKIRNTGTSLNADGQTYVYAAFGSSPFGGSNILPTPAALQSPQPTPAAGRAGLIANSLRFTGRTDGSPSLRGPVNPISSTRPGTLSMWLKFSSLEGQNRALYGNRTQSSAGSLGYILTFANQGEIQITDPQNVIDQGTAQFSDTNAWYHLVIQSRANDTSYWMNGRLVTDAGTALPFTDNNVAINWYAILQFSEPQFTALQNNSFEGYIADTYQVGQLLEPTAFAQYNDQGVWVPRTEDEITTAITDAGGYGDDGYKLIMNLSNITFGDNVLLQDQSGNENDFTMLAFELIDEDDPSYALSVDGPSTNFSTLNPLNHTGGDDGIRYAALRNADTNSGVASTYVGDLGMAAGLYYFEITRTSADNDFNCGIISVDIAITGGNIGLTEAVWINQGGDLQVDGTTTNNFLPAIGQGDTLCVAFNANTGSVWFGRNGTFVGNPAASTNPAATITVGTGWVPYVRVVGNTGDEIVDLNCGQLPFLFTVPNGYSSLQCRNLPAATITDPRTQFRVITSVSASTGYWFAGSQPLDDPFVPADEEANQVAFGQPTGTLEGKFIIDFGQEVTNAQVFVTAQILNVIFRTSTDGTTWSAQGPITFNTPSTTVNGTYRYIAISNGGGTWTPSRLEGGGEPILTQAQDTFANGLWWIKNMDATNQHQLVDISRPDDDAITSPTVQAEQAYAPPANNSIAWCWNVGTDTGTANTQGTLASTVFLNQTAGFSIVQWTGNGAFESVGHGLGARPGMVIVKTLNENQNILVGIDGVTTLSAGGNPDQWVNNDSVVVSNWSNCAILNSSVTAGNETATTGLNRSAGAGVTNNMLMYVWTPIVGFSSFGSYVGNNTNNNGTYVYTGFSVAWLMVKRVTDSGTDWIIVDSTRSPTNPADQFLIPNKQNANADGNDASNGDIDIDLLSNGFKIRSNTGSLNATSTYIYAAFGSSPFGGNNVQPANAR